MSDEPMDQREALWELTKAKARIGSLAPKELRAQAAEEGRLANRCWAFGENSKARRHIERARRLVLQALILEGSPPSDEVTLDERTLR